jgi:DNA-binding GntR family transcriptional regulator
MSSRLRLLPIERSSVIDRVTDRLRQAIMAGDLHPGTRLVEADLAKELGTSRAPVREAMQALEQEGLLVALPRGGLLIPTFRGSDAWEIYTLRAALESEAVRLALPSLASDQVEELQELIHAMRRPHSEVDVAGLTALDVQFHEKLVTMSGNARLARTWGGMMSQIQLLIRQANLPALDDPAYVADRHAQIIRALLTGDEVIAIDTVNEHIRSVGEEMRRVLGTKDVETAIDATGQIARDFSARPPSEPTDQP